MQTVIVKSINDFTITTHYSCEATILILHQKHR